MSHYPDFFDAAPVITLYDPQAEFLGAAGVAAGIVRLITGAAGADGFKGIGGRFHRDGLLRFEADIDHEILFTRRDTGEAVKVRANPAHVPTHPRLHELMTRRLAGTASETQQTDFRNLWQARVRTLLLKHADDPMVIDMQRLDTALCSRSLKPGRRNAITPAGSRHRRGRSCVIRIRARRNA